MFPLLSDIAAWLPPVDTHSAFVALGSVAGVVIFVIEMRRRRMWDYRLMFVVTGALVGAALLARLGTWAQHLDPSLNLSLVEQLAHGNASILSALLGAWIGAIVVKRLVGYRGSTGDLFAPAVALAMAVGRIACLLTERPGTPTCPGCGIVLDEAAAAYTGAEAGVALHPSFVYEIVFHAIAFGVLWLWLRHRDLPAGETLTIYIGAYAVFRFLVEFVRGGEVAWIGLTRPQLFLAVTIPLLAARIIWQARKGAYRGLRGPAATPATATATPTPTVEQP